MPVASASADPLDRFEVVVDPDADPTDLDEAVATFLLRLIRRRQTSTAPSGTPAVDLSTS